MSSKKSTAKPKLCAKCGAIDGRLSKCESGHICDGCLETFHRGRDETTILVKMDKVVTLAGRQVLEPYEISIPRSSAVAPTPKPAKPIQPLTPEIVARDAASQRAELLSYLGNECVALALDLEISMKPANQVETMLLHLMAVAYKAAMDTSSKSFLADDPVDQTRLMNLSARMMESFQRGALTLQRLKSGGNQQIVVQHVNVSQGGQAIVGNVQAGGAS